MNFRESIWGTAAVGSLFTIGLCSAARAEGPGIRNGDLVIHPEAQAGAGVDNNVFYEDSSESPVNATVTRFGLGVGLENRHPNKIGLSLDGSGFGLGTRSQRYSMIIDDGVVTALNIEEGPGKAEISGAEALLKQL
jgi:hypothetical protein